MRLWNGKVDMIVAHVDDLKEEGNSERTQKTSPCVTQPSRIPLCATQAWWVLEKIE